MEYNYQEIEARWQKKWREDQAYKVSEDPNKKKYYVLDMFPYPSGAGLHVGHPLGYIASDVYARYKRHLGFNVLHPMGYDSFGLPAEQYAIQTGQHPAITTKNNIARYREQLDKMGFCYDWSREVRTSDPEYYRWTQWIFKQLFNAWYNHDTNKAEPIDSLIAKFEDNGSYNVNAAIDENWWKELDLEAFPQFGEHFAGEFTATDWTSFSEKQQQLVLMHFRLTFLADSWVNWCPALGTVLANDEIKDGVSERGGHPVEQKLMRQWSMRISAYAQRLIDDLETVDWNDSIKEIQRNWIGRSEGAQVFFQLADHPHSIEVFTTRPDTVFGATFMVLAPEHELVETITTEEYRDEINAYVKQAKAKTERDRQANVKQVTGAFTGAYAVHPFTGDKLPVWIADYVLAGYGTGAVMAVPAGDQRDYDFAKTFRIPIPNIFEGVDISEEACADKSAVLCNSDFLDGMPAKKAISACCSRLEEMGIGKGRVNYRLRDAVFSRQRYWGEPFPVYYRDGVPYVLEDHELVTLPDVDKYLPTEDGEPPLARATQDAWNIWKGDRMEYNTMPGWAGSSWYFLRYMDALNDKEFCARSKSDYWGQVDLYIGGAEHATGHLLYSRFWTKFLYDMGHIGFSEPFAKMINQGMILGRSSFVYRIKDTNTFVTLEKKDDHETQALYADIALVDNDILNTEAFAKWREEYKGAEFILNDQGNYVCGHEVEKMSKSKFNVQTPDELVEKFGADTLRCYEMFLGPLEQAKPWDTKGINGVHNFLRKTTRLFEKADDATPSKDNLKSVHKTIKKITEDLERYSWNTVVSALMIAVNELTEQKCTSREALSPLAVLLSPYAPHLAAELWNNLGHQGSVLDAAWPQFDEKHLVEDEIEYPVSFNGKMRFKLPLPADMNPKEVEAAVMAHERTAEFLQGEPKKVIVVPGRIVNIVM
ncbi:MAG: leucine--tRNA ligase [Flavobacteriales bacterium]|nr:leucine--tRNA ligase [Flavobacteriales bacterium]